MLQNQDPNQLDESISRHDFLGLLGGLSAVTIAAQPALAAKPGQLDTPILTFVGANKHSIELQLTAAGASGAPAGFAIQWIKAFDPVSGSGEWHNQSDSRIETATFSASTEDSPYCLAPGQSVKAKIGDLVLNSGVNTTNPYALKHSTEYYFRAFALAAKHVPQSAATPNLLAGTPVLPTQCTFPPTCCSNLAWWTQNGPGKCTADSNPNLWPVNSLQLGEHNYDASDLCRILQRKGDEFGVNAMARQLIAAKLNVARGENSNFITAVIASADAIIGSQTVPANGKDGFPTEQTFALVIALTNYNEGDTGPLSCCLE